jgi:transcriptional regulator with XRE-family HTH domain
MAMDPAQQDAYHHWLMTVGKRLALHRRRMGLTQAAAAERCGMDLKHYQDAEYGRRALGTRALFAIASGLGAPLARLVDGPLPQEEAMPGTEQIAPELAAHGWVLHPVRPRSARNTAPALSVDLATEASLGAALPRFWASPPQHIALASGAFLLDLQRATRQHWRGWALCAPGLPAKLLGTWLLLPVDSLGVSAFLALARVVALAQDDDGYQITLRGAEPEAPEWRIRVARPEALAVEAHVVTFVGRNAHAANEPTAELSLTA